MAAVARNGVGLKLGGQNSVEVSVHSRRFNHLSYHLLPRWLCSWNQRPKPGTEPKITASAAGVLLQLNLYPIRPNAHSFTSCWPKRKYKALISSGGCGEALNENMQDDYLGLDHVSGLGMLGWGITIQRPLRKRDR